MSTINCVASICTYGNQKIILEIKPAKAGQSLHRFELSEQNIVLGIQQAGTFRRATNHALMELHCLQTPRGQGIRDQEAFGAIALLDVFKSL